MHLQKVTDGSQIWGYISKQIMFLDPINVDTGEVNLTSEVIGGRFEAIRKYRQKLPKKAKIILTPIKENTNDLGSILLWSSEAI